MMPGGGWIETKAPPRHLSAGNLSLGQAKLALSTQRAYLGCRKSRLRMADDAVMEILRRIQANLAGLDRRVTGQLNVLSQDVRMVRAAIHDMGETRVEELEGQRD